MSWATAVGRRRVREIRRAPWDNLFLLVAVYLIFVALYLTVRGVAGAEVDDRRWSSLIVGYVTFLLLQQSLQTFNAHVAAAGVTGTLEVLALSRPGLARVLLAEFAAQTLLDAVRMCAALTLIVVTIGQPLTVDVPRFVLALLPTLAAAAGVGLAMAGATLAFKRTSGLAAIVSLAMLAVVAAPVDRLPGLRLLPIAAGAFQLRAVASGDHEAMTALATAELYANGAAYVALGLFAFNRLERVARVRGVMGHY